MIRVGALCGVIILMLSCNASERSDYPYDFAYHGALKEMMRKGKISAVADLKDLDSIPHLYALGAIENLKGEIQIFNSQPYHTQVIDNQISFDSSYNKKATLLVYASVKAWKEFSIPREVCTYPVLEEFIEAKAKENRIDVNLPFPFLLEGTVTKLDWHVINWPRGDMDHSHEKHIQSGLNGRIENQNVSVLGFFSDRHQGIFTHHTVNSHMHFLTEDRTLAGHVDDLELGKSMVLKLPLK